MRDYSSRLACFFGVLCLFSIILSCEREEVQVVPGQVYQVSTASETGYAVFGQAGNSNRWTGTFYADRQTLFADACEISLSSDVRGLYFRDNVRKKNRIQSMVPCDALPFEEQPETWAYKDSVYAVSDLLDVRYAKAPGYWTSLPDSDDSFLDIYVSQWKEKMKKKRLPLTMDVYFPEDGRKALRPLLVLIHGGAFYNGDKASTGYPEWGRYFAGRGYVVASVNYRLGFFANSISVERAGFRAVQDVNAAIRYLVHDRETYYVDPDRVFVAGTSAGGITALNVAFMHKKNIPSAADSEGPIDAVASKLHDRFSIRAVGNMWGAVHDLTMLGNEDIAIISFHSSGDPVVPFGADYPFQSVTFNDYIFDKMYGSGEITPYARNLGRKVELHEYDMPGCHTLHLDGEEFNGIFYEIETGLRDFFSSVMLPHPVAIRHIDNSRFFSIDDTDVETVSWKVDGGLLLEADHNKAEVLLFPDATDHTVTVCGKYRSGLTFKDTFSI